MKAKRYERFYMSLGIMGKLLYNTYGYKIYDHYSEKYEAIVSELKIRIVHPLGLLFFLRELYNDIWKYGITSKDFYKDLFIKFCIV